MKDIIICVTISLVLIAIFPILLQLKSQVNNGAFNRLINIKHFSFFFRAPGGMSVSREGLALPIFISQLLGYILALILGMLNLLCCFISQNLFKMMAIVTCGIMVIEVVCLVIFDVILLRISHPTQYYKRNKH